MVSTRKKRNQQKRQFSQLNETINDFEQFRTNVGSNINVGVKENEISVSQTVGRYIHPERFADGEISACENQAIGNTVGDKIRKEVDKEVMTVENCMHDASLTAMDNVVIPRVEMAVKSFTGSSGDRTNSAVQNPDRRDFIWNAEDTPLKAAADRLDLNIDQDRIDETRDIGNFKDDDFPAFRPNYDRQAHTHLSSQKPKNLRISLHFGVKSR